jgi:hypothetical protein
MLRRAGFGGWRKTRASGAGDRGAHHKGGCLPTSVMENRAPFFIYSAVPEVRVDGAKQRLGSVCLQAHPSGSLKRSAPSSDND